MRKSLPCPILSPELSEPGAKLELSSERHTLPSQGLQETPKSMACAVGGELRARMTHRHSRSKMKSRGAVPMLAEDRSHELKVMMAQ